MISPNEARKIADKAYAVKSELAYKSDKVRKALKEIEYAAKDAKYICTLTFRLNLYEINVLRSLGYKVSVRDDRHIEIGWQQ